VWLIQVVCNFFAKTRGRTVEAMLAAIAMATSGLAHAANANVAVAANFTEPAREIAQLFESKTGDEAILSFGWQHAPDRMLP
jgi:ABC-type molybdate transport system substrate-binding protein